MPVEELAPEIDEEGGRFCLFATFSQSRWSRGLARSHPQLTPLWGPGMLRDARRKKWQKPVQRKGLEPNWLQWSVLYVPFGPLVCIPIALLPLAALPLLGFLCL